MLEAHSEAAEEQAYALIHATSLTLEKKRLERVTKLSLKSVGLRVLPPAIGSLDVLEHLDVSLNPQLHTLPDEIGELSRLRILFTLGCSFTSVPAVLGKLPALSMLSFKSNQLEHIASDALAPSIRWLILTDNRLQELPSNIGRLRGLQKLMVTNNLLTALPDSLLECPNLEMIRASDNQIAQLPSGLLEHAPLAWLALSGNPCTAAGAAGAPPARVVALEELQLGEELGKGAGGTVYQATWLAQPDGPAVAVKVFRDAAAVSDGDPTHEINAAGVVQHQNMIRVLAAVAPPSLGLVQELLAGYAPLGKPPSLETCTRDTYEEGTEFEAAFGLRALRGIAAACSHLHAARHAHGDLYAHNILVPADGEPKLGDFGATFSYGSLAAPSVEAVEVRAFGILIAEVASRMRAHETADASARAELHALAERSMGRPAERPTFSELLLKISQLL
uniref:Protein kinase domain-containing protein n=1 Tax=Calcidiscus leptoporus TaxID=127549 RepID=A0A6U5DAG8_9EUKA|mmetsp:Transcript_12977/g.29879  ORF Transcript_12977/g.29879 Transcript_12977/m.29879 type:complete len:449 (+) Transcript_12977:134-1480(+)|eukprot:CAMPEP_0119354804 /NCGR_PEP_ID=MMETSP1334-20130426/3779_1 /TAXON_ID=127549 /ORGANISM="Calcidiscus leptoporus, Strain RCC1130" /LENGTH=448 /DNA_ID=CAMNT_0007368479 /DNA_START=127 /DNA_END=1473 /DNA_ORIENTATION=+